MSTVDIDSVASGDNDRSDDAGHVVNAQTHMVSSGKPPVKAASVARGSPATAALRQFVVQAHQDLNEVHVHVVPGSQGVCVRRNLLIRMSFTLT